MKNLVLFITFLTLIYYNGSFAQQIKDISLLGQFDLQYATGVAVSGNYAYLLEYNSINFNGSMRIVDISYPGTPTLAGIYNPQDNFTPKCIVVSGNNAFIGSSYQDLRIIDISNVSIPSKIATYEEYSYDIQIIDNRAYLAAQTEGLIILDITNLANINEIGYYEPSGDAWGLFIRDTLAFLTYGSIGLKIVNHSNLINLVEMGNYDTPGSAEEVFVSGDYAYVADGGSGLRILDISDLSSPNEAGYFLLDPMQTLMSVKDIIVSDGYAYIADENFGVRVIDVNNVAAPTEVAYYETGGSNDIFLVENIIYSTGNNRLSILRNDLVTAVEEKVNLPYKNSLSQNYPNPFNPKTNIEFEILGSEQVKIILFDVLGQEREILLNAFLPPGNHHLEFDGSNYPSGIYYYKIITNDYSETKKM
jgi:hypothetical protein